MRLQVIRNGSVRKYATSEEMDPCNERPPKSRGLPAGLEVGVGARARDKGEQRCWPSLREAVGETVALTGAPARNDVEPVHTRGGNACVKTNVSAETRDGNEPRSAMHALRCGERLRIAAGVLTRGADEQMNTHRHGARVQIEAAR